MSWSSVEADVNKQWFVVLIRGHKRQLSLIVHIRSAPTTMYMVMVNKNLLKLVIILNSASRIRYVFCRALTTGGDLFILKKILAITLEGNLNTLFKGKCYYSIFL